MDLRDPGRPPLCLTLKTNTTSEATEMLSASLDTTVNGPYHNVDGGGGHEEDRGRPRGGMTEARMTSW
jgi:hypothetical protein